MQVSIENSDGLQRSLRISVPSTQIDKDVDARLQQLSKTVKLKGFRAGKIPLKVIQEQYGAEVRQEAMNKVIQQSFFDAVKQENLQPATSPNIQVEQSLAGQDLVYIASFELMPEIDLKELNDVVIEKKFAEVKDKDVLNTIEKLREQHADWQEVDRAAKTGDKVELDFVGKIDGKPFEKGSAEDFSLELGSNSMIPGFEDGLLGAKAGKSLEIKCQFPEEYHHKEVAGKDALFDVTLKKVTEAVKPELAEAFFEKLDIKEGGLDELKKQIAEFMARELKQKLSALAKDAVLDKLIELNTCDIPQSLVDQETVNMQSQMSQRVPNSNPQDFPADMFKEQATRRVKLGLLCGEIIKRYELKPDNDRVRELIAEQAALYQNPEEIVKVMLQDKNTRAQFEGIVLEEKVVAKLLEQATLKELKSSYDDVMNPA